MTARDDPRADAWRSLLPAGMPRPLVNRLEAEFAGTDPILLDPEEVAALYGIDVGTVKQVLRDLADAGMLEEEHREVCPSCSNLVGPGWKDTCECRSCGFSFEHESPKEQDIFSRAGRRTRDVKWVLTVHGVNTHGGWQQEFSWHLAKVYGYSVPVAIYKYGRRVVSPFFLYGQIAFVDELVATIQRLQDDMERHGYGRKPDVILHSFGTWLFTQCLRRDPALSVGRVILTGSIVRPDFSWRKYLDSGRVDAVLCHTAGGDWIVRLAQFGLQQAGPSGFCGFLKKAEVHHVHTPKFGHSTFFERGILEENFQTHWGPFLTLPREDLDGWVAAQGVQLRIPWTPSRLRWLASVMKHAFLCVSILLAAFGTVSLVVGAAILLHLLS